MSQITVKVDGDEKLVAAFTKVSTTARSRIKRTLQLLGGLLVEKIQRDYLSGQVLHQRTGRLAGSIHEETDETESSIITSVGTNVEYAKPHEYGFHGSVKIKAHMRQIKQAWGRPITPRAVHVRAHVRNVNITEKRFMRGALAAFRPKVTERLTRLATSLAEEAVKK